jgi:DNA-binding SARP family transcriptional activator
MKFGVLGPLLLIDDDTCCVPTAPKGQQLLALLMVNANQSVPVDTCVDELWQTDPPRSAVSTLQTYVLQIRTLFRAADEEQELLATHNRSYQLRVPHAGFDRTVFDATVRRARAATVRGDDRSAYDLFGTALGLWRGPALSGVPDGPVIAVHRIELDEIRFCVREERIETALRLGMHRELLAELHALADAYPLYENVQAQLMVALYRSGRRTEAVEIFHRLRKALSDKLGLDPVPRMLRLYEGILRGDPRLTAPEPRQAGEPARLYTSGARSRLERVRV